VCDGSGGAAPRKFTDCHRFCPRPSPSSAGLPPLGPPPLVPGLRPNQLTKRPQASGLSPEGVALGLCSASPVDKAEQGCRPPQGPLLEKLDKSPRFPEPLDRREIARAPREANSRLAKRAALAVEHAPPAERRRGRCGGMATGRRAPVSARTGRDTIPSATVAAGQSVGRPSTRGAAASAAGHCPVSNLQGDGTARGPPCRGPPVAGARRNDPGKAEWRRGTSGGEAHQVSIRPRGERLLKSSRFFIDTAKVLRLRF
jgi:hypothetical protein